MDWDKLGIKPAKVASWKDVRSTLYTKKPTIYETILKKLFNGVTKKTTELQLVLGLRLVVGSSLIIFWCTNATPWFFISRMQTHLTTQPTAPKILSSIDACIAQEATALTWRKSWSPFPAHFLQEWPLLAWARTWL